MWAEAFRVCKQYAPHLTNQLQEDFSVFDSRNESAKEPEELIEQVQCLLYFYFKYSRYLN